MAVERFPLPTVHAWMGHADIQTTMRYVHHRDRGDEADALSELIEDEGVGLPGAAVEGLRTTD